MTKTRIKSNSPCEEKNTTQADADTVSGPMHRLRKVRCREEVSREAIAKRLGIDVETVDMIENELTDLPLSVLYEWQKMLDVPIVDLLVETENAFDAPQKLRAQLETIMRTAINLSRKNRQEVVSHITQNLINQLLEIMPELNEVVLEHGRRPQRRLEEYGLELEHHFLDDMASGAMSGE